MISRLFRFIIGDALQVPLRQRLSTTAILLTSLYGIFSALVNHYSDLPQITVDLSVFVIVMYFFLYLMSRFGNRSVLATDIALSFAFIVFTPIMWLYNGGLGGGFSYFIFLFGAFTLSVVQGIRLYIYLGLLFAVTITMITIEQWHPEWVFYYKTDADKYLDVISCFILVFIGVLNLMYQYTRQYYNYSEQLKENNLELESVNNRLSNGIKEREILLKELHHRVKNNLQMISSLLNLQKNNSSNLELNNMLKVSQDRISAISMVHEQLYKSYNLQSVSLNEYLQRLIDNLKKSFSIEKQNIVVETQIEDVVIGIEQIIPLGLILNELISNSINHAFSTEGRIKIEGNLINESYMISFCDNGKGLPATFDIKKLESLGFTLIMGLAKQLNGTFVRKKSDIGVKFSIQFSIKT